MNIVEDGKFLLAVHHGEIGQFGGTRPEGCLRAGWGPSEGVEPGGVVQPSSRPSGMGFGCLVYGLMTRILVERLALANQRLTNV